MTNEEAIRVLNVAKAECEWNAPLEYQEAFDMAINALKAQLSNTSEIPNSSNLISRQDALDEWNRLSERGRTEFDQVLMMLPSTQPERERIKWIPHKSVFGELDERVYTCDKCGYNIGFHVENFCPNCGGKYER